MLGTVRKDKHKTLAVNTTKLTRTKATTSAQSSGQKKKNNSTK